MHPLRRIHRRSRHTTVDRTALESFLDAYRDGLATETLYAVSERLRAHAGEAGVLRVSDALIRVLADPRFDEPALQQLLAGTGVTPGAAVSATAFFRSLATALAWRGGQPDDERFSEPIPTPLEGEDRRTA